MGLLLIRCIWQRDRYSLDTAAFLNNFFALPARPSDRFVWAAAATSFEFGPWLLLLASMLMFVAIAGRSGQPGAHLVDGRQEQVYYHVALPTNRAAIGLCWGDSLWVVGALLVTTGFCGRLVRFLKRCSHLFLLRPRYRKMLTRTFAPEACNAHGSRIRRGGTMKVSVR
jgi:hypothetical protein